MSGRILDGKAVAESIKKGLCERIKMSYSYRPRALPNLAVCLIGDDPASHIYITNKQKACKEVGINSIFKQFPLSVSHDDIVTWLHAMNDMKSVHGILVQLPLPEVFDQNFIIQQINPLKDV